MVAPVQSTVVYCREVQTEYGVKRTRRLGGNENLQVRGIKIKSIVRDKIKWNENKKE